MNLTNISAQDFKRVFKLLKAKEKLTAKLAVIEEQLERFESGRAHRGTISDSVGLESGGKRGKLKDSIVTALQAAGKDGLEVKVLAEKLGVEGVRISTWFATTGKKIKEIKKLGRGQFAWG